MARLNQDDSGQHRVPKVWLASLDARKATSVFNRLMMRMRSITFHCWKRSRNTAQPYPMVVGLVKWCWTWSTSRSQVGDIDDHPSISNHEQHWGDAHFVGVLVSETLRIGIRLSRRTCARPQTGFKFCWRPALIFRVRSSGATAGQTALGLALKQ